MTSQTGQRKITINILPNISRSKDNWIMKFGFGQLIEHSIRNIFLEKSYKKCGEKACPRTFLKKIKIEHISGSRI